MQKDNSVSLEIEVIVLINIDSNLCHSESYLLEFPNFEISSFEEIFL